MWRLGLKGERSARDRHNALLGAAGQKADEATVLPTSASPSFAHSARDQSEDVGEHERTGDDDVPTPNNAATAEALKKAMPNPELQLSEKLQSAVHFAADSRRPDATSLDSGKAPAADPFGNVRPNSRRNTPVEVQCWHSGFEGGGSTVGDGWLHEKK